MTFKDDYTGNYAIEYNLYGVVIDSSGSFEWSVNGNKLTTTENGESATMDYSVSHNTCAVTTTGNMDMDPQDDVIVLSFEKQIN